MKTTIMNFLRNCTHVVMLFCFNYSLWYYANAIEYTLDGKIIGMSLASLTLSTCFGGAWEWCQAYFLKAVFDWNDVLRSAIGGFLGYLFYLWQPSIEFIAKWCSIAFIVLILYSVYKGYLLMKKRGVL